jgi:hypothetical protein
MLEEVYALDSKQQRGRPLFGEHKCAFGSKVFRTGFPLY